MQKNSKRGFWFNNYSLIQNRVALIKGMYAYTLFCFGSSSKELCTNDIHKILCRFCNLHPSNQPITTWSFCPLYRDNPSCVNWTSYVQGPSDKCTMGERKKRGRGCGPRIPWRDRGREGAGQPRNVALSARPMSVQPATTDFCSMRSACLKVLCGLASVTASDQTDGLYGNNGI